MQFLSSCQRFSGVRRLPSIALDEKRNIPNCGGFFRGFPNSKFAWFGHGNLLDVVSLAKGNRIACWQFQPEACITCGIGVHSGDSAFLLLGLAMDDKTGLICCFDVTSSRLLKSTFVPHPVTCLEVIQLNNNDTNCVPACFEFWRDIIAVGTSMANVLLFEFDLMSKNSEGDESNPVKYTPCDFQDYPLPQQTVLELLSNLLRSRETLAWLDSHDSHEMARCKPVFNVCTLKQTKRLLLHAKSVRLYLVCMIDSADSNKLGIEHKARACVSALRYLKQAHCLGVGFSFGGYLLVSLEDGNIVLSSTFGECGIPVTQIEFQEPENDPRNVVYFWICRGPTAVFDFKMEDEITATFELIQLNYAQKLRVPSSNVFTYTELLGSALVFMHELGVIKELLECKVIIKDGPNSRRSFVNSSTAEDTALDDTSLIFFCWRESDDVAKLALFDLNGWYLAQMPHQLRVSFDDDDYSFMMFEDLAPANANLLAAAVLPETVLRFQNHFHQTPNDLHFYASAISFDSVLLFNDCFRKHRRLGNQISLIQSIEDLGVKALDTPRQYLIKAQAVGLISTQTPGDFVLATDVEQKEALLTLMLENGCVEFLFSCIRTVALNPGGVSFASNWIFREAKRAKQMLDSFNIHLYQDSGVEIADSQRALLALQRSVLQTLTLLFEHLLKSATSNYANEAFVSELQTKYFGICLVEKYAQIVTWMLDHKILPVYRGRSKSLAIYNADEMLRRTNRMRRQMLNQRRCLFVDLLLNGAGKPLLEFWQREHHGDDGYPAPSLAALCGGYLLEDVAVDVKNVVTLYSLLDMISLNEEDQQDELRDLLVQFDFAFMRNSESHWLYDLTWAFWFIDHGDKLSGVSSLIQSCLKGVGLSDSSAAGTSKKSSADCAIADAEWLDALRPGLAVVVADVLNGPLARTNDDQGTARLHDLSQINELIELAKKTRGDSTNEHVKSVYKLLPKLISLPVADEEWLQKFVPTEDASSSNDAAILFCISRSKFADALKLTDSTPKLAAGKRKAPRDVPVGSASSGFIRATTSLSESLHDLKKCFEDIVPEFRYKKTLKLSQPDSSTKLTASTSKSFDVGSILPEKTSFRPMSVDLLASGRRDGRMVAQSTETSHVMNVLQRQRRAVFEASAETPSPLRRQAINNFSTLKSAGKMTGNAEESIGSGFGSVRRTTFGGPKDLIGVLSMILSPVSTTKRPTFNHNSTPTSNSVDRMPGSSTNVLNYAKTIFKNSRNISEVRSLLATPPAVKIRPPFDFSIATTSGQPLPILRLRSSSQSTNGSYPASPSSGKHLRFDLPMSSSGLAIGEDVAATDPPIECRRLSYPKESALVGANRSPLLLRDSGLMEELESEETLFESNQANLDSYTPYCVEPNEANDAIVSASNDVESTNDELVSEETLFESNQANLDSYTPYCVEPNETNDAIVSASNDVEPTNDELESEETLFESNQASSATPCSVALNETNDAIVSASNDVESTNDVLELESEETSFESNLGSATPCYVTPNETNDAIVSASNDVESTNDGVETSAVSEAGDVADGDAIAHFNSPAANEDMTMPSKAKCEDVSTRPSSWTSSRYLQFMEKPSLGPDDYFSGGAESGISSYEKNSDELLSAASTEELIDGLPQNLGDLSQASKTAVASVVNDLNDVAITDSDDVGRQSSCSQDSTCSRSSLSSEVSETRSRRESLPTHPAPSFAASATPLSLKPNAVSQATVAAGLDVEASSDDEETPTDSDVHDAVRSGCTTGLRQPDQNNAALTPLEAECDDEKTAMSMPTTSLLTAGSRTPEHAVSLPGDADEAPRDAGCDNSASLIRCARPKLVAVEPLPEITSLLEGDGSPCVTRMMRSGRRTPTPTRQICSVAKPPPLESPSRRSARILALQSSEAVSATNANNEEATQTSITGSRKSPRRKMVASSTNGDISNGKNVTHTDDNEVSQSLNDQSQHSPAVASASKRGRGRPRKRSDSALSHGSETSSIASDITLDGLNDATLIAQDDVDRQSSCSRASTCSRSSLASETSRTRRRGRPPKHPVIAELADAESSADFSFSPPRRIAEVDSVIQGKPSNATSSEDREFAFSPPVTRHNVSLRMRASSQDTPSNSLNENVEETIAGPSYQNGSDQETLGSASKAALKAPKSSVSGRRTRPSIAPSNTPIRLPRLPSIDELKAATNTRGLTLIDSPEIQLMRNGRVRVTDRRLTGLLTKEDILELERANQKGTKRQASSKKDVR